MPQYQSYGPLDSPITTDGDSFFRGLNSYANPEILNEGVYQSGKNIRIEGGEIVPRKGMYNVAKALNATGKIVASGVFTDKNQNDHLFFMEVSGTSLNEWRWTPSQSAQSVSATGGSYTLSPNSSFTQAYDRMFFHQQDGESFKLDSDDPETASWAPIDHSNQVTSPINMPKGAWWSVFYRSRVAIPRNGTEMVISDIADTNAFDVRSQFTFNKGGRDYIVGAIGWKEDKLLVLMRNSIQQINGLVDLTASSSEEITNQYGCVARKTIVQDGNAVMFLSDRGIVRASTTQDLKIQESTIPFSRNIQDQIDGRNRSSEKNAVAAIYDNKYYLAFPTDGHIYCDKLAVYDLLLEEWVSVDEFHENTEIVDLHVMNVWGSQRLIATTSSSSGNGGVFIMEYTSDGKDEYINGVLVQSQDVASTLKTRKLNFGTVDKKKFSRTNISVVSEEIGSAPTLPVDLDFVLNDNASTTYDLSVNTYEPDKTVTYSSVTQTTNEDSIRKNLVSRSGKSADMDIAITGGKTRVRSAVLTASIEGDNLITDN